MTKSSKNINIQIVWYLFGVFLPMATLFVRSPIYTRIYSTELYGQYTLVFITYAYLAALFFQWISSAAWRYYKKYKDSNRILIYNQTLVGLYSISLIILLAITVAWYFLSGDVFQKQLILLGFLFSTLQEIINTFLIPMRMRVEAKKYNVINSSRAIASFLLLLILTFYFDYKIEAFFIAPILINLTFIALYLFKTDFTSFFKGPVSSKYSVHMFRFFKYGITTLVFSSCLLLLANSDRYVILLFSSIEKVGIYNQTYNIAQISITALITAINAALNPLLLSTLDKKPNQSNTNLNNALYLVVYICLPITFVLSLFSKQIAYILLGQEFREAYYIMPWIFFGAFLNGISHFGSVKLKFKNKFRKMLIPSISAVILNVVLNLIFIPVFSYVAAAYTTLATYLFFTFFIFYQAELKILSDKTQLFRLLKIGLILLVLYLLHITFQSLSFINIDSIMVAIIEALLLLSIFLVLSYNISPFKLNLVKNEE